ncbi:MAG: two-component system response regulator [Gammaproteobacteria bacterium]|nr:response regulator [Gammaproteobacteria bacterium]PCH62732.1 MAG: two-component system response regulator [Gammaproteobacteria bacterium]PCH64177.1 MAG: two-component system response regulator [Gammaproteobacteria bacterium]
MLLGQKRILVIDDDEPSRTLAQRILTRGGFDVDTAANGEEALEKAITFKYDLIVLDVMMPKMDGFEVCARLQQNSLTADLPVVMLTALDSLDDVAKATEAGAKWFVTKPFDSKYLLRRIRQIIFYQDNPHSQS